MTATLAPADLDRVRPRERVSLAGMILATGTIRVGGSPVCRCVLAAAEGELDLLFLGRATIAGLTAGTRCSVQGTVALHHGRLAVWNPRYQVWP
jgi:hypothetical protein